MKLCPIWPEVCFSSLCWNGEVGVSQWWRTVAVHQLFLETHMLRRLCSQATVNTFVQRWDLLLANSCLLNHAVRQEFHLNLPWKIQVIPPLRISAVLLPDTDRHRYLNHVEYSHGFVQGGYLNSICIRNYVQAWRYYVNIYCYEIHKAIRANIAISCTIVGVQWQDKHFEIYCFI